jgi:hypothetical protein
MKRNETYNTEATDVRLHAGARFPGDPTSLEPVETAHSQVREPVEEGEVRKRTDPPALALGAGYAP